MDTQDLIPFQLRLSRPTSYFALKAAIVLIVVYGQIAAEIVAITALIHVGWSLV